MSMDVTFYNVTITITASSPEAAYKKLCDTLGEADDLDWSTDIYTTTSEGIMSGERDTEELFPQNEKGGDHG